MFRKLVSCAVVAALMIGMSGMLRAAEDKPKPTLEERFKKLDKDGDGFVSLKEYVGRNTGEKAEKITAAFKLKDKDGDGMWTFDEYKSKPPKKPKDK